MGSLKALFLVSGAVIGMMSLAEAADLLPPPPPMAPMAPEFAGWYLRGDVGVGISSGNINVSTTPDPLATLGPGGTNTYNNSTISSSALFDLGIGYQVNNWLRFDVTGEYRGGGHFQTLEQAYAPGLTPVSNYLDFYRGDVSSWIGLFNGYVDIGTWYGVTPFVGAGVGFANNTLSGVTDVGSVCQGGPCGSSGGYLNDGSKTSLAWALMAGFDFNVTQNLKLELGYRFLDYGSLKSGTSNCSNGAGGFSAAQCGGGGYTISTRNDLYSQDVRLGLRWAFTDVPTYEPEPQPLVRKY
jgi:opacity protein-like surface antigen